MTDTATHSETATIVVFEREPFWVPELRRQFLHEEVAVRACRTVRDLDESVGSTSQVIAVVNLGDAAADLLRWLSRRLVTGRSVPTVVVASEAMESLEWHAREAGAIAVVSEFISGRQLARLVRKQWPHVRRADSTAIRKTT